MEMDFVSHHHRHILTICPTCRSGKSSIQKVVFHKMSPNETLFLESTSKVVKDGKHTAAGVPPPFAAVSHVYCHVCTLSLGADISNSSFVQFQIWDFPGQLSFLDEAFDCDAIFGGCGALVFVIDAQVSMICTVVLRLLSLF